MHETKAIFRVIEADFNARRSDYSLLDPHVLFIGQTEPGDQDFIDQNVQIEFSEMSFKKHGSDAAEGPVGVGHYYPASQLVSDEIVINFYSAAPRNLIRTEIYRVQFIFISHDPDQYGRRCVIARLRFLSGVNQPSNIKSVWLDSLDEATDGYLDLNLTVDCNIHYFINNYSFIGGMYGKATLNYYGYSLDDAIAGTDLDGVTGTNTTTIADSLFDIPEGCQG